MARVTAASCELLIWIALDVDVHKTWVQAASGACDGKVMFFQE